MNGGIPLYQRIVLFSFAAIVSCAVFLSVFFTYHEKQLDNESYKTVYISSSTFRFEHYMYSYRIPMIKNKKVDSVLQQFIHQEVSSFTSGINKEQDFHQLSIDFNDNYFNNYIYEVNFTEKKQSNSEKTKVIHQAFAFDTRNGSLIQPGMGSFHPFAEPIQISYVIQPKVFVEPEIMLAASSIDPSKKQIALTFDDGPSPISTPIVLDILKQYHIHATFFLVGSNAEKYPELVKRIHDEGNIIGNHTYHHADLRRLPVEGIQSEINVTDGIIKNDIGEITKFYRPPYGAFNPLVKNTVTKQMVLWDVDPEDWKYHNAPYVANQVLTHAGNGKIVLMHDIYLTSADALKAIIPTLLNSGYQFVTVDQIIKK